MIGDLEGVLQLDEATENERIREEDEKSRQAGKVLSDRAIVAERLLSKVREALKEIDQDDNAAG